MFPKNTIHFKDALLFLAVAYKAEREIVITPSSDEAKIGEDLELDCELKGKTSSDPVFTTWTKVDGTVSSPNVKMNEGKLT